MSKAIRYEVQPKAPVRVITYHFVDHPKIWRHWHEYLELIYFVRGRLTLRVDGRRAEVQPGDLVVFNECEAHESLALSPENEYYVFELPPEYFHAVKAAQNHRYQTVIRGDPAVTAAAKAAAALTDAENSTFLLNAKLFELLHLISQRHAVRQAAERPASAPTLAEDLKARIADCYREPLSLPQLAASFSVSVSHLQHVFKAQTGTTVIEYINRTRIENAAQLLTDSTLRVGEIAARVGIPDDTYFSRLFKRYKGCAPLAYRQARQGQPPVRPF